MSDAPGEEFAAEAGLTGGEKERKYRNMGSMMHLGVGFTVNAYAIALGGVAMKEFSMAYDKQYLSPETWLILTAIGAGVCFLWWLTQLKLHGVGLYASFLMTASFTLSLVYFALLNNNNTFDYPCGGANYSINFTRSLGGVLGSVALALLYVGATLIRAHGGPREAFLSPRKMGSTIAGNTGWKPPAGRLHLDADDEPIVVELHAMKLRRDGAANTCLYCILMYNDNALKGGFPKGARSAFASEQRPTSFAYCCEDHRTSDRERHEGTRIKDEDVFLRAIQRAAKGNFYSS